MGCIKKWINPAIANHVSRNFTADFTKTVIKVVSTVYTISIIIGFGFEVNWKIVLENELIDELRNIHTDDVRD
jgi:hypothetical protein